MRYHGHTIYGSLIIDSSVGFVHLPQPPPGVAAHIGTQEDPCFTKVLGHMQLCTNDVWVNTNVQVASLNKVGKHDITYT